MIKQYHFWVYTQKESKSAYRRDTCVVYYGTFTLAKL
jgi:hypothetical protein